MIRFFYKIKEYDQTIEIVKRQIVKYNCTCRDFAFRKLPNNLGPCKHIKAAMAFIDPAIYDGIPPSKPNRLQEK